MLAAIRSAATGLLEDFERDGTFGQTLHLHPGRDDRFTARDWRILFKRVPRLRIALVLGSILKFICRFPSRQGYGYVASTRNSLSFSHDSFFNNLLVWEILLELREFVEDAIYIRIANGARKTLSSFQGSGRKIKLSGFELEMFSYFASPMRSNGKGRILCRTLNLLDIDAPENDSTSLILSCKHRISTLLRIDDREYWGKADWKYVLEILYVPLSPSENPGINSFSYENGVSAEDRGVLTWIGDESNEMDPTSNINVAGFLAVVYSHLDSSSRAKAGKILCGIFGFLAAHARRGDLLSPRFQQYYPLGAALFFWRRFLHIWESVSPETALKLDPESRVGEIEGQVRSWVTEEAKNSFRHWNPADLIWASTYLEDRGLAANLPMISPEQLRAYADRNAPEVFHLLYPVPMLCAPKGLFLAAHLQGLQSKFRKLFPDVNASC